MRYRSGRWISEKELLKDPRLHQPRNEEPHESVDLEDMLEKCHPETRPLFREILQGKTVEEIALGEVSRQSFESTEQRVVSLALRTAELRKILAYEWGRLTR